MSKKSKKHSKSSQNKGIKNVEKEVGKIEEDVGKMEKDVKHLEKDVRMFSKFENVVFEIIIILIFGIALGALAGYMVGLSSPLSSPASGNLATTSASGLGSAPAGLGGEIEDFVNTNLINDPSINVEVSDSNKETEPLYSYDYAITQEGEVVEEGLFYSTGKNLILGSTFDLSAGEENGGETDGEASGEETGEFQKSETPKVDLFIMSFCPYGLSTAKAFYEPISLFGENIDFDIGYVIYSDYATSLRENYGVDATWEEYCTDANETYCSMHGIEEVKEDVRQLCIQKYQNEKFWPYMNLLIGDYDAGKVSASNIADKWKIYAEGAGVDVEAVEECAATESEALLEEQKLLNGLYGVQGSPHTVINGSVYGGARAPEPFKEAVCSSFIEAPEACTAELSGETEGPQGTC